MTTREKGQEGATMDDLTPAQQQRVEDLIKTLHAEGLAAAHGVLAYIPEEVVALVSRLVQAQDAEGWQQPQLVNVYLLREMQAYLGRLTITGDNIGDIRRSLFMPFDSSWNGLVRDETAKRELPAPPFAPSKEVV